MNTTNNTTVPEPSSPKVAEIRSLYNKYAAEKRRIFELFHGERSVSKEARKFVLEEICEPDETLGLIKELSENLSDAERTEVELFAFYWIVDGSDEWEESFSRIKEDF